MPVFIVFQHLTTVEESGNCLTLDFFRGLQVPLFKSIALRLNKDVTWYCIWLICYNRHGFQCGVMLLCFQKLPMSPTWDLIGLIWEVHVSLCLFVCLFSDEKTTDQWTWPPRWGMSPSTSMNFWSHHSATSLFKWNLQPCGLMSHMASSDDTDISATVPSSSNHFIILAHIAFKQPNTSE